jgi:GNAT superfamily N-acetyltransferase
MRIRPATAADYPVFERLFPELRTGDATSSERVWARDLAPQSLVLDREGDAAGYVYFQILDGLGYIRHVVVDPNHRRAGVGLALMTEVAGRLRAAGIGEWCLNVKPDNEPAIRLYARMGMSLQYACVAMRMTWDIAERLPSASPHLVVEPARAEDDTAVEAAFRLPRGLLAKQRAMAGARIFVAQQSDAIAGVAVFFPEFPGAYPFRAREAAHARALLAAMRGNADPSKAWVQLVFEDAPDLAAAFEAAGARRHMEFVHLRGAVPAHVIPSPP